MFRKKQPPVDTDMLKNITLHLQSDNTLYDFDYRLESIKYNFAINFPVKPHLETLEDNIGVFYQHAAPDTIVYSIGVFDTEHEEDKNTVANDILSGVTGDPLWHEYSDREHVIIAKGYSALTQTFKSSDDTFLMSTIVYTERFHYMIQVQNVYFEHAASKLSQFIDTFELI